MTTPTITEVLPKDPTLLFSNDQRALLPLAKSAHVAADTFAEKWRAMVEFIHAHKMGQEEYTPVLIHAGFNKARSSEIGRIASSSESTVQDFLTKRLSWKASLEKAREERPSKRKGAGRKVSPSLPYFQALKKTMRLNDKSNVKPFATTRDGGLAIVICQGWQKFSGRLSLPSGDQIEVSITHLAKTK